ncbi:LAME_0H06062g1_1 [Lachancea meyersii CBS 8951]|uniref:THO complex subunit 2 n=1 Tax=Lachancea meyersii CBS 8951 TaxID=1266667 RepID=A0A1G4KEE5_9SACH|nr:LAME_0H06062g1_1 [Lachancea meyersii CBS 8951]
MASVCSQINALSTASLNGFLESFGSFKRNTEDLNTFTQDLIDQLATCDDRKQRKQQVQSLLYEIIMLLTVNGTGGLSVEDACHVIKKVHAAEGPKTARLFIALLNGFPEKSERLVELVRILDVMDSDFSTYVNDDKLLESANKFTAKQRALFKKSLLDNGYMIHKYNLLSEHPVAYSELITLMLVAYEDPANFESAARYCHEAQCIIGKYSLDPLRALDVILVVSARFVTTQYHFLVQFLRASAFWPEETADCRLAQNLSNGGSIMAAQLLTMHLNNDNVDVQFYDMVCVLVKAGFVSFTSIYDNLGPSDEIIGKFTDKFYMDLEADSMKGVSNPLAMAAALADDTENEEKLPTDNDQTNETAENIEEKTEATEEIKEKDILKGGKMLLIQRLLAHGAIVPFLSAFQKNSRFFMVSQDVARLYLRLFEHSITPLYHSSISYSSALVTQKAKKLTPTHEVFQTLQSYSVNDFYYGECMEDVEMVSDVEELFKACHQWLSLLGPHIARSPSVVSKLCRIGFKDLQLSEKCETKLKAWLNFTRKFIFSALPLLTENIVIINEAYELFKHFDYEQRFFLYNELSSKLSQDNIFLKAAWNSASREAKTELKSLSMDNVDKKGKNFAKIIAKNPLSTLDPVLNQLENYDKLSDLVVETSLHFTQFTYDVLQYHILLRLTSGRKSLQDSGIHVMTWVQRIAVFIAGLAKKSPKMDITNIIRFVIKKLHLNDMIAVTIIREMTSRVGGVKAINDLSPKQLIMLNSGRPLQEIARTVIRDSRADNSHPALRLLKVFIDENALTEVILLLDHLSKSSTEEDSHYKVLSSKIDDINLLLWAFIDMSKYFLGSRVFGENVADFDQLISEYSLSIEWAFFIWREYYDDFAHDDARPREQFELAIEKASFIPREFEGEHKDLFVKFWLLSLYDVCFRRELYDDEKLTIENSLMKTRSSKRKRELSRQIEGVMASRIAHQRAHNKFLESLTVSSISVERLKSADMIMPFLQYCVIPRVLFSPADALFVVAFIWETFGFSGALDIFEDIVTTRILGPLLFSSTTSEASNLGLFLATYLEKLECRRKQKEISGHDLKRLFKAQSLIAEDVVNLILEQNYMSIRNGIEFMKHLSAVFPVVKYDILQMTEAMEKLIAVDKREDILLPSNALVGHLKARLKTALDLDAFYSMSEEEKVSFDFEKKDLVMKYHKALEEEENEKRLKSNAEREIESKQGNESTQANETAIERDSASHVNSRFGRVPPLPMYEILNEMWDVEKCLEANRTAYLYRHMRNKTLLSQLQKIEKETIMNPEEYRSQLAELLESFYRSLVSSVNHEKFKLRLSGILRACKSTTNPYGTKKKTEGRYQAPPIEYDDEPTSSSTTVPSKKRIAESRSTASVVHADENKRPSRYSGIKATEQNENRLGKSNGNKKAVSSRRDPGKPDSGLDKGHFSSALNIKSSKGPGLSGPETSSSRAGSRYERKAITPVGGETGNFNKAQSPIPRGPARTASQRSGTSNSRFGDASANQSKISNRSSLESPRFESTKRPRDESVSTASNKRGKPDSGVDRSRFSNQAHGAGPDLSDRMTSKQPPKQTGRFDSRHHGERSSDTFSSKLPSGPRSHKSRSSRESRASPVPENSTPQQSRYQK